MFSGKARDEDDGHAGGDDDGDDLASSDDEERDEDGSDEGADGETGLSRRRMTRAAGDHPLQSSLRWATGGRGRRHKA